MPTESVHVAMMNLLWPRRGLARQTFYDYWSGAHTQISSRLPGIHQYFQHHLDAELGGLFPGVTDRTTHPGFFGDAEITFASAEDLSTFAAALSPLMEDEQNVFDKTISYQATGDNVATLVDHTLDDSPNGDLGSAEKYMLYVRRDRSKGLDEFRSSVKAAAATMADAPDITKVRYRLVEPYDNEAVTLLAPNVSNYEPDETQIHACLEIVFPDALARRRFGASAASEHLLGVLGDASSDIFPTRAVRTYTVYNHGRITLAGLRTPQMAAQITSIGAVNQVSETTRQLMLAEHAQAAD